jgi:hypothetical protein
MSERWSVLVTLAAVTLAGCAARRPPACPMPDLSALPVQPGTPPPLWGPFLTKLDYLDGAQSRPPRSDVVTAPGSLPGRWLAADADGSLEVETVDMTGGTDVGRQLFGAAQEFFQVRMAAPECRAEYLFRAAFGAFRVYGIDVDGDGRDEVVVEHGDAGPNPYSYRRRLQILRVSREAADDPPGCTFTPLFDATLNGLGANYVNVRAAGTTMSMPVPHAWLRRYRFTDPAADGRVAVELCVADGADRTARVGSADWTTALQFPRLRYRLDPGLGVFTLEEFDFVALTAAP